MEQIKEHLREFDGKLDQLEDRINRSDRPVAAKVASEIERLRGQRDALEEEVDALQTLGSQASAEMSHVLEQGLQDLERTYDRIAVVYGAGQAGPTTR